MNFGSDIGGASSPTTKPNTTGIDFELFKIFFPFLLVIASIIAGALIIRRINNNLKDTKCENREKLVTIRTILYYTIIIIIIITLVVIGIKISEPAYETEIPFVVGKYNVTTETFEIKLKTTQYYNEIEFRISMYSETGEFIDSYYITEKNLEENKEYIIKHKLTPNEVKHIKYFKYEIDSIKQGISNNRYGNLVWYYITP